MKRVFEEYRGTALWSALERALADLQESGEIEIQTAPDYVIGFLSQELAAKWVVASSALTRER